MKYYIKSDNIYYIDYDKGDKVMKKLSNKIKNINNFSIIVVKMCLILSIGYFIIAMICQSTIDDAVSVVREVNNINSFVRLGIINFVSAFILGYLFHLKLENNKKCE